MTIAVPDRSPQRNARRPVRPAKFPLAAPGRSRCTTARCGGGCGRRTAKHVEIVLIDGDRTTDVRMNAEAGGYFTHTEPDVRDGQRATPYRLDGGAGPAGPVLAVAARRRARPVRGRADRAFQLDRRRLEGCPPRRPGPLRAARRHLHAGGHVRRDHPAAARTCSDLGVTAIELMPVAQFPGSRNWGYDGVLPYAAQNTYGGPHGLQQLVDAGPRGTGSPSSSTSSTTTSAPRATTSHEFGPYFTDQYKTPWGAAVNYDDAGSDAVRDFVLDNARMWLEEFHLDGLRLDAVHAIYDLGARHILRAIKEVADDVAAQHGPRDPRHRRERPERPAHRPAARARRARAGRAVERRLPPRRPRAAHRRAPRLLRRLRRARAPGQGARTRRSCTPATYSPHPRPQARRPADGPARRPVRRLHPEPRPGRQPRPRRPADDAARRPAKQRLAAELLLLSPYVPLLFMGEEYGETARSRSSARSAGEELIQAVREGRKREFADFLGGGEEVPAARRGRDVRVGEAELVVARRDRPRRRSASFTATCSAPASNGPH